MDSYQYFMNIRIIYLGKVSPLRSQSVYRGLAASMREESTPILVFLRPDSPFVSVGMHQNVQSEIDTQWCNAKKLPVIQRPVGGGTVYLDEQQLFFQYVFPKNQLPTRPEEIYKLLLQPVVQTFRSIGLTSTHIEKNDIHYQGKKICGTGAATLDNASVCVGNFLFDFSHKSMAHCISSPSNAFKHCFAELLTEKITTINQELSKQPTDDQLIHLMSLHIKEVIGLNPVYDELTDKEYRAIQDIETTDDDNDWEYGFNKRLIKHGIKITSTHYLLENSVLSDDSLVYLRVLTNNDSVERIWIESSSKSLILQNLQLTINETKPSLYELKQLLFFHFPESNSAIRALLEFNPY